MIALTLLVLVLVATLSALVAGAVTRRAAAQRIDAAVTALDDDRDRPPADRPTPALDQALDDLERSVAVELRRRDRSAEAENRLSWALGAIANGVV
ncbi:MAG TPA: hypothetical protein VJM49_22610, partial [Acidimicrobiales bacterium]|nr:hypothetical protein [Acidimicrobiales bacterium]